MTVNAGFHVCFRGGIAETCGGSIHAGLRGLKLKRGMDDHSISEKKSYVQRSIVRLAQRRALIGTKNEFQCETELCVGVNTRTAS